MFVGEIIKPGFGQDDYSDSGYDYESAMSEAGQAGFSTDSGDLASDYENAMQYAAGVQSAEENTMSDADMDSLMQDMMGEFSASQDAINNPDTWLENWLQSQGVDTSQVPQSSIDDLAKIMVDSMPEAPGTETNLPSTTKPSTGYTPSIGFPSSAVTSGGITGGKTGTQSTTANNPSLANALASVFGTKYASQSIFSGSMGTLAIVALGVALVLLMRK